MIEKDHLGDWSPEKDNLCGSHLQSQVIVVVSLKFKNPGERFDWSIDRVAVGKCVNVIGCEGVCGDRLCK